MSETDFGDPARSNQSVIAQAPSRPDTDSLYRMHMHRVARWVERLAGPSLDWEDIVHEVFVIAHQRIGGFRGDASITTWLFSITDKVVRRRRFKERWRRWLSGSADETAGHLPSAWPDPLRMAERKQTAATVYGVLDRLSGRDRQILILCEIEGLAAEEVGELLGIKPANARLRLHRAHRRFLRVYEDYERKEREGRRDHVGG